MDSKSRYLQSEYAKERGVTWYESKMKKNPDYPQRMFDLLSDGGVIPKRENLDGFAFVSISANRADMETEVATLLDERMKGEEFVHPPKVIAMDFLGLREGEKKDRSYNRFVSGIKPKTIPNLKTVEFSRISADANNLPLAEGSVDVLFDRLGFIWHSLNDKSGHISIHVDRTKLLKKVLEILKKLAVFLKSDGKIVVDAFGNYENDYEEVGCATSTAGVLKEIGVLNHGGLEELKELGLEIEFIGEGADRLLVFKKAKE